MIWNQLSCVLASGSSDSFVSAVRNHFWMPSMMVHRRSAAVDASLRCFVSLSMNCSREFVLEWQRYK
jgi:hypothetical protein